MATAYGGVIDELVAGTWVEPDTGKRYSIPPDAIVIEKSLDGAEAELVRQQHDNQSLMVVCDAFTHDALGARVFTALQKGGLKVEKFVWQQPSCSEAGVEELRLATRGADALIAIGSGTVNDSVKYASYLDQREYSVFATSPMNAYTTNTASVSFDGFKKSITCHGAKGIFFDLSVIAQCPPRLISAAFADVICRTTAQVDWLMSHLLFDTAYAETPYTLLAIDEPTMIANASDMLTGDIDALGMLTRISAIMGLGTSFTETTHSGSMAEHMISHYIDMFAGDQHPGTSHGEQVGVATVTLSRLHNQILTANSPPQMQPTVIPKDELHERYGTEMASMMIEQTGIKALDQRKADLLNERFANEWESFSNRLRKVMLPFDTLLSAMKEAGCQTSAAELGVAGEFYRKAILDARYIRDRFSMLDIAGDSGQLDTFAGQQV
ncbi:MAG: iron-containing alcohol dehydrogenase [Gammaproteobacteria bacterium]|nr:iron-containing alcohol dehydrogenase [Gammaproteobacteria bacterium]